MFFDTWFGLLRTVVVGALGYAGLVLILRASGKRTLAKMNAFDLVVTVALGSTLATMLLSKDVALLEGLLGLAVLIGLQYAVTWLSVRFAAARRLVRADPALLFYRGELLARQLRAERVTESEVYQAVRSQGWGGLEEVEAVVLESDGTFSVVGKSDAGPGTALEGVRGVEAAAGSETEAEPLARSS